MWQKTAPRAEAREQYTTMGAVFTPRANLMVRGGLAGLALLVTAVGLGAYAYTHSPWATGVGRFVSQTVPFSHQHHVAGLGLDCRFCHTSVEDSPFAGIPPTQTCMRCHSELWTQAEVLEPVRTSWQTEQPLHWGRVNRVPDYVYFDHSVHVNNGVGCVTCHGRVDQMPLMTKAQTLYMKWCLGCHRDPAPNLRPRAALFSMDWEPPDDPAAGAALLKAYGIQTTGLTNCSACHR
jgi:hypothetical protein